MASKETVNQLVFEVDIKKILADELEDRTAKIAEIEKNIYEIHDIYEQLSFEILNQGEIVNSIENHIMNANNNTFEATKHFEEAVKHTHWFGIFGKIYGIVKFVNKII
jgi:t-SNARE complex subunit (syntaxin)